MSNPSQRKLSGLQSYVVYSNMGIEMGVIIALGVFGGIKLDKIYDCSPIFTITLSLLGVIISIYVLTKTVLRSNKHNNDESKNTH